MIICFLSFFLFLFEMAQGKNVRFLSLLFLLFFHLLFPFCLCFSQEGNDKQHFHISKQHKRFKVNEHCEEISVCVAVVTVIEDEMNE